MVEEGPSQKQTPVVVQAAQQSTTVKLIVTIVLVLVLIALGFYGYAWASSSVGQQKLSDFRTSVAKYNPLTFYLESLETAKQTGQIWDTKTAEEEKKVGVKFQSFSAIGNKIVPAGSTLAFKYKFDVGEGVKGTVLDLGCELKEDSSSMLKSDPQLIPEKPEVYTDNPLSYSNILCQMETMADLEEDKIIKVDGKVGFTQENQRGSLRVYFTKDIINFGEKFFEKYAIEEDLPIRAIYNDEPVELGIGVSDENIQPIILAENYFQSVGISLRNRWDGKVKKVNSMTLSLPQEVKIDKTKSPASIICPFGNVESTGRGYVSYKAEQRFLDQIPEIGEDGEPYQRFFCWLEVDDSILGGSQYVQDQYSVSISYDYEFKAKTETVTIKSTGAIMEEETEGETA